jgi:predicted transcriptional regulator
MNGMIVSESTSLAELRKQIPDVKQSVVALQMNINESAVSKLERKRLVDASVIKVKQYVEAIGGKLVMTIMLPDGQEINI